MKRVQSAWFVTRNVANVSVKKTLKVWIVIFVKMVSFPTPNFHLVQVFSLFTYNFPYFFNFLSLKACECHPEGSDGPNCSLNGICSCKKHVVGEKCDKCENGYANHPKCDECDTAFYGNNGTQCRPCECNEKGSKSQDCDKTSGDCDCKENVVGKHCDQCKEGFGGFPDCKSKYFSKSFNDLNFVLMINFSQMWL